LIGSFDQKLFFCLIPESVRPTVRFTGLFPKVIGAGADFCLAQIAHAFTRLGLAAAAELLANRGDRVADLANRSLNVLRGRAQTAAPEPHLAGLSQVDLATILYCTPVPDHGLNLCKFDVFVSLQSMRRFRICS
jgi:hypothetical protein